MEFESSNEILHGRYLSKLSFLGQKCGSFALIVRAVNYKHDSSGYTIMIDSSEGEEEFLFILIDVSQWLSISAATALWITKLPASISLRWQKILRMPNTVLSDCGRTFPYDSSACRILECSSQKSWSEVYNLSVQLKRFHLQKGNLLPEFF